MSAAQLFKKYPPRAFGQLESSAVKHLLNSILENEMSRYKVDLGINGKNWRHEKFSIPEWKFTFWLQNPAFAQFYIPLLPYIFTGSYLQLVWKPFMVTFSLERQRWTIGSVTGG